MSNFSFEAYNGANDPRCEFCGRQYMQGIDLDATFQVDACLLDNCLSRPWFLREVERRYPEGVPPAKDFSEHQFEIQFEAEEYNLWRPTLVCTDPCPEQFHTYRSIIDNEYRMCSCEAVSECFGDPELWFDDFRIKARPVYSTFRTYEGDWDADIYVEVIGDNQ